MELEGLERKISLEFALVYLHWRQALAQAPTSLAKPGQTKLAKTNLWDPLTPG
jgi:hypothetical protein